MPMEVRMGPELHSHPPPPPPWIWLRGAPEQEPGGEAAPDDAPDTQEEEERVLRCRACGTPIASERDVFGVGGASPVQTFVNPAGFVWEILTLRAAPGAIVHGRPTSDFTWFAGTTWRFAACSGCGGHLGWFYEGAREPTSFYGLVRDRLHLGP